MSERQCRICLLPIVWAFDKVGVPIVVDRQTTIDGDVWLATGSDGKLYSVDYAPGVAAYNIHKCPPAKPKRASVRRNDTQRVQDVAAALKRADQARVYHEQNAGDETSRAEAYALATLASEVRRQQTFTREREAVDALLVAYAEFVGLSINQRAASMDRLPGRLVTCLEALKASRDGYYM
jgi:hypothetical protein